MTVKVTLEFATAEKAIRALTAIGGLVKSAGNIATPSEGAGRPVPSKTAEKMLRRHHINPDEIEGTGKFGKLLVSDVHEFIKARQKRKEDETEAPAPEVIDKAPAEPEPDPDFDEPEKEAPEKPVAKTSAPAPADTPTKRPITLDGCRDALKEVNAKDGLQACLDVLSRFGVRRVSEVPEARYEDFLKMCDSVLAGGQP